jgi:hypothetical protein
MRDFKEPRYTGPECVCCKKPDVEIKLDKVGAQLVESIRQQERERLITKFEEADSACSDWAIAIIEEKLQSNAIFSEEKLQSNTIDGEINE